VLALAADMARLRVDALGILITAAILYLAQVADLAALDFAFTLIAKVASTFVCARSSGSANRVVHTRGHGRVLQLVAVIDWCALVQTNEFHAFNHF
jgi:hypothetical protein